MTTGALTDLEPKQADLIAQIAEEVKLVEDELSRQVASQVELVSKIGAHTLEAGGKRLRPAFVSLAARATGLPYDEARARHLGACMEMIHMATLVHDDVIDHAAIRRGRATASSIYGNTAAILTGDVLLSKAMSILAQDGDLNIIRCVSRAVVEMAEGEVKELELRGRFDVSEPDHLNVLRMKTAAFIESCCEVGALVAGAPKEVLDALKLYGHHVGLAFQIVDDLLDYRGSEEKTGKPLATDYKEGCATLPLIYLSDKLSPSEEELTRKGFGNGIGDTELASIISWMRDRGAFAQTEQTALGNLDKAVAALDPLPSSSAHTLLSGVADFIMRREG
ncbi:MAG: octaprenyl-diphosphate synthase [Fimbriimonadaceae bacterium]|jgi:octaprenyl-diphosphate synthase|nr:octaprenyl-diphosphate synthase [Fimbriimonadaceae bacterium]